ncbi:MAG: LamG domain-containing protein [Saprospiraceae bacterium]|nr:LamG domain-containing protein [Saprospiraceae bacterium]
MKRILFFLMICLSVFSHKETNAQCDNLALAFDNLNPNFVSLNPSPITGATDFTIEATFYANNLGTACLGDFRPLLSLHNPNNSHSFELGICNGGQLHFFWFNGSPAFPLSPIPISSTNLTGAWHHVAVTRTGTFVNFYVDGNAVFSTTMSTAPFSFTNFHVGRGGGVVLGQGWDGQADEVRLWSTVRTQAQIQDFKDCTLSGTSPNLIVNWTFDQTAPGPLSVSGGGNNSALIGIGLVVTDLSGNGNDGTLNNFTLNGTTSNFVCNLCLPLYDLNISDLGSQSIFLAAICSGNGAHFCVTQGGASINIPGATVMWEYSDIGGPPFISVTTSGFVGYCFGMPSLDISAECLTSPTGYVDRTYRAKISKTLTVGSLTLTCTYYTTERTLRIYCPVTNASISMVPPLPTPPIVALCEGTNYSTNVSIGSLHPFVPFAVSPFGDLSIQWCIDGLPVLPLTDMPSFQYNNAPNFPDLCFEAKLQNGVCPLFTTKTCIPVDKDPKCGTIDATPDFPVLMHDPNGGPFDYLICPGNDAELTMVNPFMDCNAVWQYMFPNTNPIWTDLNGIGNSIQNTNVLPQGPGQPVWPAGETCIQYRIECRPLSYPYSDCAPCHSNIVQICLKTPKAAPVITAGQNPICKSGSPTSTTISVLPYDANCTYNWYCNGILVGNGPSIIATMKGCYWVEVFDGCFKQVSQPLNLDVCEVVAVILCPTDNPCACPGQPVTLDGCSSWDSCNLPLTSYSWTGTDGQSSSGCLFTDLPNLNGTTYTLTVTNAIGCTGSASLTINPCQ